MATINNTTSRPLRIPLPGGKRLHLAPRRTAEVAPKALEFPALKALIDAGDVEVVSSGKKSGSTPTGPASKPGGGRSDSGSGSVRHTGDR